MEVPYVRQGINTGVGEHAKSTWADLADGDTGQPISVFDFADRSVQVKGTFDGASVSFKGSNDSGASWVTLRDPFGNPLVITSANLHAVLESCEMVRPEISGGGAATELTVILFARRQP